MEYFLWRDNLTDSNVQAVLADVPVEFSKSGVRFDAGVQLRDLPELPLRLRLGAESTGRELTDNVLTYGRWAIVCSQRLRTVLEHVGVANIQWFPALIEDSISGMAHSPFWIGNVVGRVDCVDWSRARLDDLEVYFEPLWIDESKVHGLKMFRQAEYEHHLLVDESVRDALVNAGVSGVKFTPANGFVDGS